MSLNALLKTGAAETTSLQTTLSLTEYLEAWDSDKGISLNTAGRMLRAIGKPEIIETSSDKLVSDGRFSKQERARLARMFSGRTIYRYPAFRHFRGIEDQLHQVVQFFALGAKSAQQRKQILYICGSFGGGKSLLAKYLKEAYEKELVYVLAFKRKEGESPIMSPLFGSPLELFDDALHGTTLEDKFKIPRDRLDVPMSRWTAERLEEANGDFEKFCVVPVKPSIAKRICIARVEPGDERTSVSVLVGNRGQSGQPYDYTGGLNRTTQGILEFVEIFNARPSLLKPLLSAPQDGVYAGDGDVGELPYQGLIIGHSNEPDFIRFKKNLVDPALINRINLVNFPYNLSITAETEIYRDGLDETGYRDLPVTPGALEVAAHFPIATRVNIDTRGGRMRVYDGRPSDSVGDMTTDTLRAEANWREAMEGVSPRSMLAWLSSIANVNPEETGLDPVTILKALQRIIVEEGVPEYNEIGALDALEKFVKPRCEEIVTLMIQRAFPENYESHLRDKFTEYFGLLDAWVDTRDYKNPETKAILNQEQIAKELLRIEGGITSLQDDNAREKFRRSVWRASRIFFDDGVPSAETLPWSGLDEDTWLAFEKNFLPKRELMLPTEAAMQLDKKLFTIAFVQRDRAEDRKKHVEFIARLCTMNTNEKARTTVTERQARRLVEWYIVHCK